MKITNKSGKIIGIGKELLLPGQTIEVEDAFDNNSTVKAFADMGFIAVEKEAVEKADTDTVKTPKTKKAKVTAEAEEVKE